MERLPIFSDTWELGVFEWTLPGKGSPPHVPAATALIPPLHLSRGCNAVLPDSCLVSSPRPLTAGSQRFLFPALSKAFRNFREWWMEKKRL